MKTQNRTHWLGFVGIVAVVMVLLGGFGLHVATAQDGADDFGRRVAGLYFVRETTTGVVHLISLHADGNFQGISSEQEGGVPEFNPFSDQVGTWIQTGPREITAKVIDITYNRSPMTLFGFGVVRYVLTFDEDFNTFTGPLEGGVIGPDGDPNDPQAEFLFTFAAPLEGARVPVQFPEGFPATRAKP